MLGFYITILSFVGSWEYKGKESNKHYLLYAYYLLYALYISINIYICTIYILLILVILIRYTTNEIYATYISCYTTFNTKINPWCRYYDSIFYQWGNWGQKLDNSSEDLHPVSGKGLVCFWQIPSSKTLSSSLKDRCHSAQWGEISLAFVTNSILRDIVGVHSLDDNRVVGVKLKSRSK